MVIVTVTLLLAAYIVGGVGHLALRALEAGWEAGA